jgi:hypothetical protein
MVAPLGIWMRMSVLTGGPFVDVGARSNVIRCTSRIGMRGGPELVLGGDKFASLYTVAAKVPLVVKN